MTLFARLRRAVLSVVVLCAASSALGQEIPRRVVPTAVDGIRLIRRTDLSFGSFISTPAAGTVTIDPAGGRTVVGAVPFGAGSFSAARFSVEMIGNGNPHYSILLPGSVILSNGAGATMVVDTFTSNPAGTGRVDPPARVGELTVGATLRINAAQAPGTYAASFNVTVNIQ